MPKVVHPTAKPIVAKPAPSTTKSAHVDDVANDSEEGDPIVEARARPSSTTAVNTDEFAAKSIAGPPKVTLVDVLAVAALPSSQRIAGWRTAHFDDAKAACTKRMEEDPNAPLASMLDIKADIGPSLDEQPPLPAAIERQLQRFQASGGKLDIERITTLPSDVQHYVVVGAGMAGAAAGAIFADANAAGANLKGVVLEGTSRLGGRARDVDVNGKKAGLGPSWLHGKYNQLRKVADGLGLKRERTYLDREVYVDGRKASDKVAEQLWHEEERAEDAMKKAALAGAESKGGDPASKFFPPGRWAGVAEAEMGRGDQGMEINKVDPIDGADFSSNQDDFIAEGMQEFVSRLARATQMKVAFDAQVKRATKGDDGIWTLLLKDGRSVRTKQVVYTGSTNALHNIDFRGALPSAKSEIVKDALPMGNFTKFLFTTKEPLERPGTFKNSWVVDAETDKKTGKLVEHVQFVVKYGGDAKANIMFAAAHVAKEILALPDSQRARYIEKRFGLVAGKPVHVDALFITPFATEKNFQGCYSNLLPGKEGAHTVWAAPVHGLNFAGEAAGTAQNNASLLAAFTSGIDSAYDVIKATKLR